MSCIMRHCILLHSLRHVLRHGKLSYVTPTCSIYFISVTCADGISGPGENWSGACVCLFVQFLLKWMSNCDLDIWIAGSHYQGHILKLRVIGQLIFHGRRCC